MNQTKEGWEERFDAKFSKRLDTRGYSVFGNQTRSDVVAFILQVEKEAEQRVAKEWADDVKNFANAMKENKFEAAAAVFEQKAEDIKHQYNITE